MTSQFKLNRYTLADFANYLLGEYDADRIDLQDDKALELLNEYLPRNLMVKRILPQRENRFDSYKMRERLGIK